MMWWPNGWSWGGWLVMTLTMVGFWGFVAWLFVTLIRQPQSRHEQQPNPDEILAERFARGEIDEEEFTKRKAVLRADR